MKKLQKYKSGFTLIELLVVVAIIGILASVVFSSLSDARKRARDAKRITIARQIETALELYYLDKGHYVTYPSLYGEGPVDDSNSDGDGNGIYFLDPLVEGGYLDIDYDDVYISEGSHWSTTSGFRYFPYNQAYADAYSCDGSFYVLWVYLESVTGNDQHPSSPGFTCPGRNFSIDANYVIGKYDN